MNMYIYILDLHKLFNTIKLKNKYLGTQIFRQTRQVKIYTGYKMWYRLLLLIPVLVIKG